MGKRQKITIPANCEEQWYVEAIVSAKRVMTPRGEIIEFDITHDGWLYLIKWADWPSSDNTWEPISSLDGEGCHDLIKRFWENVPGGQRQFMTNRLDYVVSSNEQYIKKEILRFAQLTPRNEVDAQNANPLRSPYERISLQRMMSAGPPHTPPSSLKSALSALRTPAKSRQPQRKISFADKNEISEIIGSGEWAKKGTRKYCGVRNTAQHEAVYTLPMKRHGPGSVSSGSRSRSASSGEFSGSDSAAASTSAALMESSGARSRKRKRGRGRSKRLASDSAAGDALAFGQPSLLLSVQPPSLPVPFVSQYTGRDADSEPMLVPDDTSIPLVDSMNSAGPTMAFLKQAGIIGGGYTVFCGVF
ncbi:Chromo domain-containing protein [Mycena chlorophos]|uniref:Chromo domain-containing protein n=1 Tax=Mycena chlorophos TaxID=658473 RepID=A0A8H6SQ63_MYCCL|nr:Chromo domain-containing protein [Mycena chlorophos]